MTVQSQKNPLQAAGQSPSSTDQILDLLLDALAERQKARQEESSPRPPVSAGAGLSPSGERAEAQVPPAPTPAKPVAPPPAAERAEAQVPPAPTPERPVAPPPAAERDLPPPSPAPAEKRRAATPPAARLPSVEAKPEPGSGEEGWQPPPALPSIQMGKLLGRLAILLALLVVVINIPIRSHGVSLARILPDTASLAIRDGLVLKGSGPNIYILQDEKLRWISSLEAFEHLRLTWKDVHVVDDEFLADFEMGRPIHLVLKCDSSPHIYAYENGVKRWIKDIDTFTAEGYIWDDVQRVGCAYLRGLPDGPPIPEDAGTPPQP